MRRSRHELAIEAPADGGRGRAMRSRRARPAATLLVRLAPQERAAVVLKDVFDFSLEEVAEALGRRRPAR